MWLNKHALPDVPGWNNLFGMDIVQPLRNFDQDALHIQIGRDGDSWRDAKVDRACGEDLLLVNRALNTIVISIGIRPSADIALKGC